MILNELDVVAIGFFEGAGSKTGTARKKVK